MGDLHVVLIQNYTYPSLLAPVGKNSLFTRITHLRLEDPMGLAPFQLVVDMPRLTHLAIPCWYDENLDEIPSRISGTSVKVFVVVLKYLDESECQVFEDWIRESRKENEWIYAVGQQDLLEEEWNAEVRGVTTIWERAAAHTRLLMNRA
ncbi:hypothetical protein BD779DRAFT_1581715 [Infundibulicybe gibba]|nr:hypothetical protein BD779DRAFT_1581715 [Infundibulicybe gibba]